MKLAGYYSSGQFARMAGVSLKTVRYYDKQNILKPSYRNPSGARFYTQEDFGRLQQILLLKYLGFSLEDIKELSIDTSDYQFLLNSLQLQKKLVRDRIEQMQVVESAIEETVHVIKCEKKIDWSQMLELIHLTGMEKSMKSQYQDAGNISARIRLHSQFSTNPQGWFPWIFEQCSIQNTSKVLELGCGNGALWTDNVGKIPGNVEIVLSDISEGMLRDAKREINEHVKDKCIQEQFQYVVCDCQELPFDAESFDLVVANHVLFYCDDIEKVCREIKRVLTPNGIFLCSTYGSKHMQEITRLVQDFDSRIVLSAESLYERFGLENGETFLKPLFSEVKLCRYEDSIELKNGQLLLEYILSCHGNQNQFLLDKYKEFKAFVMERVRYGFSITKDAGIFICEK